MHTYIILIVNEFLIFSYMHLNDDGVAGGSSGSTHSSSSSESCRSAEPVPVPSQRATFHQMTSSGSSDQIHQPESPRHPQGASPSRPSPPPRSQPINMRRVSDNKAPDLSSISPPAVRINVPPSLQICDIYIFLALEIRCNYYPMFVLIYIVYS